MLNRLFRSSLFILLLFAAPGAFAELVQIVQTTDLHGCIGILDKKPGIARIGTLVRKIRQEAAKSGGVDPVLFIDCGDLTQGSYAAALDHGKSMVAAMNQMRADVWVPGNHDFDFGVPSLIARIREFKGDVLAANLEFHEPGVPCKPWKLYVRNHIRIAVIGMAPAYLTQWIASEQLRGVRALPPLDAIRRIMPSIMKESPDLIVLAVHCGEFTSGRLNADGKTRSLSEWTREFPQIRLVLGGHTHQLVAGKKLYPDSWFVQAGSLSESVIHCTANLDRVRKTLSLQSVSVSAANEKEDRGVVEVLTPIRERAEALAFRKYAPVTEPLQPMKQASPGQPLAKLFCRALVHGVPGAKGAFHGTLSGFEKTSGVLTDWDVFRLAPYENYITLLDLSPAECRALLEEQFHLKDPSYFMRCEGVEYELGRDQKVIPPLKVNGRPWTSETERIPFAFGSYAVSGGGGRFPVLRAVASSGKVNRRELDLTVRDVLRTWLSVSEKNGK